MRVVFPAFALALAGCSHGERPTATTPPAPASAPDWRTVATPADRQRLRDWRKAWLAALPQARADDAGGMAAQGALFAPDLALADPTPPPGDYRCRVFKLGGKGVGMQGFTAYPPFDCRLARDGGELAFTKLTGSQRPVGHVYADGGRRAVFLGSLVLGDERGAMRYGTDAQRDMAGWVERIGPRRWRVVLPYPRFESLLDVVELVPAGGDPRR